MADSPRILKSTWVAIVAALFVAGMYAWAAWPNQFVYDDHEVIERQFPIHSYTDIAAIFTEPHYLNFPYYRPITRTSLAIQRTIWGLNPRPFHLFNAMLAGALLLAIYALLRRPGLVLSAPAAVMVAVWLGAHPAISECVYPAASGRETLLPALFIVLSVWAYLRRDWLGYWLAILFLILGILSKEQAAVLPAIFLLADLLGIVQRKKWGWGYLPIATIFVGYFIARWFIFHGPTLHLNIQHDPAGPGWAMLYGIQTAFLPFGELHYEPQRIAWFNGLLCGTSLVALGLLIIFVGKSPRPVRIAAIFWLGWFVILQLPTAHILVQEAAFSERYTALAILAVPAVVAALAVNKFKSRSARSAALFVGIVWAAIVGWISWTVRSTAYINDQSFAIQWENTDPSAPGPHRGLGYIAQEKGDFNTAIEQYETTLAIDPSDRTSRVNLANILTDKRDFRSAKREYETLLRQDPNDVEVLTHYANMLGEMAAIQGNPRARDLAMTMLQAALKLRPHDAQVHFSLGLYYHAFGPRENAIEEYRTALKLNPELSDARTRLDQLLKPSTKP